MSTGQVRISPVPAPSEDVMKLPREDMTTFGRCPAWDNFVLVTCEKCDKIVKIEAFESHLTLRHGSKSERSAYNRVLAAKAAASLQSCEVKLTPCSTATHSSSNSSVSQSTSPARHPSPSPEPMDTVESEQVQARRRKYVSEEADSTTNNVISIPDTDDMANIGIISEGQSLLDSMDSKFSFSQSSNTQAVDSTSFSMSSSSVPKSSVVESMDTSETTVSSPLATQYISVSPLSKPSANKKLVTVGRMTQPHPAPHPAPPASEKKSSRDREYDPNKHCGVVDPDSRKPCTRSLTCKSHSVYLKRKVLGRSGEFDELLANHKAEKEAAAKLVTPAADDSNSSILERRLKLSSSPLTAVNNSPTRILGQIQVVPQQQSNNYSKDILCEDTLHYTTGELFRSALLCCQN